ncbi:uncharacterized protein LAJ45_09250 [Morchella importuna]|uniref:PQ loop repeat protein n=1 Tax=Morchella conica CCBAS932 TaxID=1392247 RepID=A0A3N4KVP9_9PEZI|nr:uncharacterized protein LAJ45_09250 [Morchella importuna]KAH8146876.1 hypothetical protein LAJ45_09250 [Morchella importuna]RPB12431.1 hypothetical protein P167DRAFT_605601 [Morchella conica CCBAS932]
MNFLVLIVQKVAPIFLVTSPLTSYADQIRNIHITKSSRGFSLDTPLIMLVASILRCFYWIGSRFETSLLLQSLIMILVQGVLLKVALDHRSTGDERVPFAGVVYPTKRPFNFWQWRPQRPYWEFLAYFFVITAILQLFFGSSEFFVGLLGYCALGVEAGLPIPQVLANQKARSCKGFRLSVLVSWLIGDIMKTVFFYSSDHVGMQFRLCAGIQFALDAYLGFQFWMFGNGELAKDFEMS